MNGAESLLRTLVLSGVETCFANPGTSEMHFVAALDQFTEMRSIACLAENVATGAADGYGRMAAKPAATLLHCGPGLANGISNLHNAKRANTPVLNLVGDQATYHAPLDPPLVSDTASLAATVSSWVRTSTRSDSVGVDAAEAIRSAISHPGSVSTLILPSDVCWNAGGEVSGPMEPARPPLVDENAVMNASRALSSGAPTFMILGGKALRQPTLELAFAICAKTGAQLIAPSQIARIERGLGRPPVARLPYPVDQAIALLSEAANLILVGAKAPVAFFAYPGKPGALAPPGVQMQTLAHLSEDSTNALERLASVLGVTRAAGEHPGTRSIDLPTGKPTSATLGAALSALLPEGAVVVDESVSFGRGLFAGTEKAAPHDWLQLTGGAIGSGIPMSVGAAVAAHGRRVVNLEADGSALYTIQGLWTQAREGLDVTTVILSNRRYAILLGELKNVGAKAGNAALDLMSLERPTIDWPSLAKSFGVEAAQATDMTRFNDLFREANARRGPFLIELVVD